MNLYSAPLKRPTYGQERYLSQKPSQKDLHFKYSRVIKSFLSGVTAEVLRMRLKQAADAYFMSVKNFLECKKVNIILALKDNDSFLLLVYPPYDVSPDLMKWNTRLLCLVLRACNCLSVREQDDVSFLGKICRRHFNNSRQKASCGTVTKKWSLAKREWFKLCSAVQRMAESVNDSLLLKEVRNFICKVEMETRTTNARKETQARLESLIAELIADNAFSRHREENMTDEAKQMVKRQMFNTSSTERPQKRRRPKSAGARLTMSKSFETNLYNSDKKVIITQRPKTAEKLNLSTPSPGRTKRTEDNATHKSPYLTIHRSKTDIPTRNVSSARGNKVMARKRPQSATERVSETSNKLIIRERPLASKGNTSGMNEQGKHVINANIGRVNSSRISKNLMQREVWNKQRIPGGRSAQNLKLLDDRKHKVEQKIETTVNTKSTVASKQTKPVRRVHSKLKSNVSRPVVTRKLKSARTVYKTQTSNVKDMLLHASTEEASFIEVDEKKYCENGRHVHHKTVMYKEKLKLPEDETVQADNLQENVDKDTKATQKTYEQDKESMKKEATASDLNEVQICSDKRRVFDDNMKRIANEVLVHQQIDVAARNPLLKNKEFVDEFFAFLNENHVTKKFLRAQSTEPHQSWKLPNGKRVNFSFFLAFVFRHVDNNDMDMVSYVVEKMLLRMRCKHDVKMKTEAFDKDNRQSRSVIKSACDKKTAAKKRSRSARTRNLTREGSFARMGIRDDRPTSKNLDSNKRSMGKSNDTDKTLNKEETLKLYRSTSITDNQCWKCLQKDEAMTACVNWGNRCLCELLISKGVRYKEEHLSAAVKANDMVTLVRIVDFLKEHGKWNGNKQEPKDALFLARKLCLRQMADFLTETGVKDNRVVHRNSCTPCFVA